MGVAIPQIITEDRASGALVVDGSLRFDSSKSQYLSRTPASASNQKTWTWSGWIKGPFNAASYPRILNVEGPSSGYRTAVRFTDTSQLEMYSYDGSNFQWQLTTTQLFRDPSAWYHLLIAFDTTQSTSSNRVKFYINGVQITTFATASYPSQNFDAAVNHTSAHTIGGGQPLSAYLSNPYLIDGQALDPSYFGYTDALTNTWRPKKLSSSVAFGTNGFYLPFDGSAPIGQDQSGRGNNWTPVNFGGSNTLEKATGALPILNTDGGGKVARVGVRTDSSASSLVLALPLVGIKSDFSNAVNSGTSNKAITANGNAAASSSYSNFYGGSFAFDGTGDYLTVTNSSDFDFGSGNYTLEVWAYPTDVSTTRNILSRSYDGGTGNYSGFILSTANFLETTSQSSWDINISKTLIANTWQHLAVVRSGNTWTYYVNGVSSGTATVSGSVPTGPGDVQIGRRSGQGEFQGYMSDVRFYKGLAKYTQNFIPASTDPDILPDTPSGVSYSSNLTQITDGAVALGANTDYLNIGSSNDYSLPGDFTVELYLNASFPYTSPTYPSPLTFNKGGTETQLYYNTASSFISWYYSGGDVVTASLSGGWNHIAVTRSGSTVYMFVNGILRNSATNANTFGGSASYPSYVGVYAPSSGSALGGFISNLHIVKGTALYTSNFTPPTGPISSVANTKLLCCKSNSSATAFDVSPGTITANGNAVATNFNPFTANINTQRGKQSGYCTWNPLDFNSSGTLSNGNLQWANTSDAHYSVRSSFSMKTGKWYAEGTVLVNTNSVGSAFGIALRTASLSSYTGDTGSWSYHCNGNKYLNGASGVSFGIAYGTTVGNVVGLAFDADNGNLDGYLNGVYQGRVVSGLSSNDYFWMVNSYNWTWATNFGQKPFKFPPPAGFQPLALANTPRPTIVRPDQYVGVATYTGTGAARSINTGFKPDFVWIKDRSNGYNHVLFDSVRGTGGSKVLFSNRTTAEGGGTGEEGTVYGHVSSFDTSGFSVSPGSGSPLWVSSSGDNYVTWAWKAGGNSNTYNINDVGYATASAAGLTAGTITPTGASVNTKSGFSIITYTGNGTSGATVSHGLGNTPGLLIVKRRSNTGSTANWAVLHSSLTAGYNLFLNTTDNAQAYSPSRFTSTVPTSTVFSLGSGDETNYSGGTFVAYSWAEIPGFSKFGLYTGGGSAGRFIYTGFKPKVIWAKNYNSSSYLSYTGWYMWDSVRSTYNYNQSSLIASSAYQEGIRNNGGSIYSVGVDILSNGFCLRGADDADTNWTSGEYIYCAWGEVPTQNLYGAQSNAR